jgi:hypothetical protein
VDRPDSNFQFGQFYNDVIVLREDINEPNSIFQEKKINEKFYLRDVISKKGQTASKTKNSKKLTLRELSSPLFDEIPNKKCPTFSKNLMGGFCFGSK